MKFTSAVLISFVTGATAFTQHSKLAFSPRLQKQTAGTATHVPRTGSSSRCSDLCSCPACTTSKPCGCSACRGSTALFSTPTVEDASPADVDDSAPPEVEAMDGIESPEEAHNAERPARKSIAKNKATPGKPLSEFQVGQTVTGKVRSIMTYGAFMDFGAESDGLLHISALSTEFVDDVKSVLDMGAEYEVRIVSIDLDNKKIGLSKLSTDEEAAQQEAKGPRQQNRGGNRGKEQQMVAELAGSTWDDSKFIAGEVVNTADFGAFVRFDIHDLVETVDAGSMVDGLVHISCLAEGRVSSVADVAKKGEKVQIRLKSVQNKKISLSMVSVEAEKTKMENRGGGGGGGEFEGNKNWKEAVEALEDGMSVMTNIPLVKRS